MGTLDSVGDSLDSPLAITFGARNSAFLHSAQDFHNQRVKTSRRIHKLRKHVGCTSKDTKHYKHRIPQENKQLVLLLLAERDYLYAVELQASRDNNNSTKSKHKLLTTRLKKALKYAEQLVETFQETDTAKSATTAHAESLVYAELIRALLYLSTSRFQGAVNAYSLARIGLQWLEKREEANILYKEIVEETIDENLKLAIFRAEGITTSVDLNEYVKKHLANSSHELIRLIKETQPELLAVDNQNSVKSIQWRSYTARVKDETIAIYLHKASRVELEGLQSFDEVLTLYQDSVTLQLANVAKEDSSDEQDDEILLSYLRYNLLLTRVHRDTTLLWSRELSPSKQLSCSKEVHVQTIKIIDGICSTLKEIQELPGVYSDDELFKNLEFLKNYFIGAKLELLGNFFLELKEFPRALALATEAVKLLRDTSLSLSFSFLTNDQISQLKARAIKLEQVSFILASQARGTDSEILSLKLTPVPVKPVLFDTAFNYIDYGSTPAATDSTDKRSKLFGIF